MKIKKIFASLMAVTVLGTAIPVLTLKSPETAITANSEFIEYQYEEGYLTYTIIDGTIEIIKCERDVTEVEIPAEINGRKVTSIRDWAFSGCTALTEIIIPESVTNIGFNAFGDTPWLENKRKENPLVIVNGILY